MAPSCQVSKAQRQRSSAWLVLAVSAAAMQLATGAAMACDGSSYAFTIEVGSNVTGGGLSVRLDRAKFLSDVPDKYYISVKDGNEVLGEHVVLHQHDSVSFKTKCGTVTIGADRKSVFGGNALKLNWSYF